MNKQLILPLFVLTCLASCTRVSFIYSISDKKEEKIFKKEMLGKWGPSGEDGKELVTIDSSFSEDSGFVYKISIFGKDEDLGFGDLSNFNGELFDLQGKLFLMLSTDYGSEQFKEVGRYNMATMIPTYYVVRIYSIKNDMMEIGVLDGEEFMKLVHSKKITIKHEVIEEKKDGEPVDIIVFEKSNELKKKLIELEKFPGVYERTTHHKIK